MTPGKVVFQNELMQLIQYAPATEQVYKRPLLIVPPWINKYYILDLREKNSFVKWAVEQGHTVFIVSWVNPDARFAGKTFEDYLNEGPLAALDAIEQRDRRAAKSNLIGFCLGGTLLATALGYLAAKGDKRVAQRDVLRDAASISSEAGELEVFVDEQQVEALEKRMEERGYLEGSEMATTFNMLRANDLIWSFVVNNYLLGRDPFPFDLLYWNSDSTRMPAAMHSYYLRNMYLRNLLRAAGRTRARTTRRWISTRVDDAALLHLDGRRSHRAVEVVLRRGAPLQRPRALRARRLGTHRRHHQSAGREQVRLLDQRCAARESPEAWLEGATQHAGSWWTDWASGSKRTGQRESARRASPEPASSPRSRTRPDRT